jgi:phospholipase C
LLGAHRSATVAFDPLESDHGWYDIALTLDGQPAYARRFAGHLTNGKPSITG